MSLRSNPTNSPVSPIVPLSNGNYIVLSPNWNNKRGAVTWGSASTGVSGAISAANSLVGSNPGDSVGSYENQAIAGPISGVTPLVNGNYVVTSLNWNSGTGAVTWATAALGSAVRSPPPIAWSAAIPGIRWVASMGGTA